MPCHALPGIAQIERRPARDVSLEELRTYWRENRRRTRLERAAPLLLPLLGTLAFDAHRPLLLDGALGDWRALHRWRDLHWLRATCGERRVP